ncbi:MAG: metallopeptidase family protein [Minwuia sp.]|uniref:metallopeptidase family protein n=1 Tax=Minwuia sp. TaxID=2493630 RepID=UPI003A84B7F1
MTDTAPDLDVIARMGEEALNQIPAELRRHCEGLVIRVADFADDEVLQDLGIEDPFELMGLYQGVALPYRSVMDPGGENDCVWLYRRPILDYWTESGESLRHIVRHVMIHEIGHHFGFSDDDMDTIESLD